MIELKPFEPLGQIQVPPSKSIAQRLIIMSVFADGETLIRNAGASGDVLSAIGAAQALGASIAGLSTGAGAQAPRALRILPAAEGAVARNTVIDCGESATLARMLSPILPAADLSRKSFSTYIVTGSKSLLERPMEETARFLASLGIHCSPRDGRLPMLISGTLRSGIHRARSPDSSQPVSGALLGLSLVPGNSLLVVREPESPQYIMLTMELANRAGAKIEYERKGALCLWQVQGGRKFSLPDTTVKHDWRSAALLLAAAGLKGSITVKAMNPGSFQADIKILELLDTFGAKVETTGNEDGTFDYTVSEGKRRPFSADLSGTPDLFPAAALLAAAGDGESTLYGVHRLAGKESDRGKELSQLVTGLGALCAVQGDAMLIRGRDAFSDCRLAISADHRIVMAAMLASSRLQNGASMVLQLDTDATIAEATGKSYPEFASDFTALGGKFYEQSR